MFKSRAMGSGVVPGLAVHLLDLRRRHDKRRDRGIFEGSPVEVNKPFPGLGHELYGIPHLDVISRVSPDRRLLRIKKEIEVAVLILIQATTAHSLRVPYAPLALFGPEAAPNKKDSFGIGQLIKPIIAPSSVRHRLPDAPTHESYPVSR